MHASNGKVMLWTVLVSTLLLTISTGGAEAQGVRDNRGTEFILTFTENFQRDKNPPRLFITTQSATTDVTVTLPATGYTTTVTATNGQVTDVALDRTAVELRGSQKSDKAIHVTSDEEIVIYGVFAEHASSDAYLALPTDVLGTEYFAACATVRRSWAEEGFTDLPSEFGVVGVSDGTTVTINPTQAVTFGGTSYPAGQDFTVSLDRFETLQVQSTEDLTGSRITSSHPVSVLSGNLFTVVGNNQQGSGDHIVEMIPPVDTWGKEFVTAPLAKRTAGDIFRIVAARDNTQVTVTGRTPRNLNAGEFWEFEADSNEYLHVTSDEPVLLAQYSKTASADNTDTDPFLLIIPPVAQFEADYTFSTIDLLVTGTSTTHHVNLVIQSADIAGLLFDGQPLPGSTVWHPVPGTNYEATDLTISAGTHTASHASPIATFGLFSYGYTLLEAYGYPGGLRLAQISAPCTTTQTVTNDRVDNDCDGRVDEELLDGIDNDGDGLIDEDLASVCGATDVVFVIDRSSSIGMSNFNLAKEFVAEALQCFNDRGVQVGIGYILYDCVPEKIISLGTYTSDNAVLPGIILNQMQYGGRKRTYLAIRYMKDTSNFRNGAARAAVILTNGVQTTGDQVAEADLARNAGIELYSVAIGRSNFVDSIALDDIAGSATNVFDTSDPCALANRILDDLSCT
ncbi:IgGFc-binding protein-like [Branchiostoma floridae x Branchiostoma belcheri]